ncbi:hypothetical protein ACLOJK_021177 [Asimina triloba]
MGCNRSVLGLEKTINHDAESGLRRRWVIVMPDLVFARSCEWSASRRSTLGVVRQRVTMPDLGKKSSTARWVFSSVEATTVDSPNVVVGLTALKDMAVMDLANLNDFRRKIGFSNQKSSGGFLPESRIQSAERIDRQREVGSSGFFISEDKEDPGTGKISATNCS